MAEYESAAETKPPEDYKRWLAEIDLADKEERSWRERAAKCVDKYRDDKDRDGRRFNIFWSNVETLKPAVYSQTPVPVVQRRFLDSDPVGRKAAETLQRALKFTMDDYDFDGTMESVRDDLLIVGRGQAWIEYEGEIERKTPEKDEYGGFRLGDRMVEPSYDDDDTDRANPYVEEKGHESVKCCYLYWRDFLMAPARKWEDVRWVARRHTMTRDDLRKEFGDKLGNAVSLTLDTGDEAEKDKKDRPDTFKRAEVFEIWDKAGKQRIWVSRGYEGVLRTQDDPLHLDGFFPCPEPLYGVHTSDNMVPIPEYTIYQDQADELDLMTSRIDRLIDALKVRGFFAGELNKPLTDLLKGGDNFILPVTDWAMIERLGGLDKAIALMPLKELGDVLVGLYQQREALKQEIYEITGISDLIRGSTKGQETATAQQLKGNFGNMRMQPRAKPMQRFARDVLRLKAEVIAEHFSPENLSAMTGQPVDPQVMALLRDDRMRGFRIDIETDSTIAPDADAEKEQATEFVTASAGYFEKMGALGQVEPMLIPLMLEMYKMAARRYRASRELEDKIDQTAEAISQKVMQMMQNPPLNPEAEKMRMEMEKMQAEFGLEREKHAAEMQAMQAKTQLELEGDRAKLGMELEAERARQQVDLQGQVMDAEVKREVAAGQMQMEREKHAQSMEQQRQAGTLKLMQQKAAAKAKPEARA